MKYRSRKALQQARRLIVAERREADWAFRLDEARAELRKELRAADWGDERLSSEAHRITRQADGVPAPRATPLPAAASIAGLVPPGEAAPASPRARARAA